MAIQVKIDNIDRTNFISQESLQISNQLTRQVDTCKFSISRVIGSLKLDFTPSIGKIVQVLQGADKIFAGVIIRVSQKLDMNGIVVFDIECEDFTRFLDRKLVPDTYESMTVEAIINSMVANYTKADDNITTNNVDCPVLVDYIGFNYLPVSKCFTELADMVNYDWYIDFDKDIHFFSKDTNPAPVEVNDTNGSYLLNTLEIKRDNSQVRNVVYVRGGEYLGAVFTTQMVADGSQNIFNLAYKYQDLSVTLTGQRLNVGIDNIDTDTSYDVLWNFQEKIIKFRDVRKPSIGSVLRVGGKPYLPVRVKIRDINSIADMAAAEGGSGEYEFLIIDNSIESKEAARDRASAELKAYKATLNEAKFSTYTNGFKAGQQVVINSDLHDVHESFIISQVNYKMWTHNKFVYDITLVTTKTYGIIEYLQSLLIDKTKQFVFNKDEIIDVVEAVSETVSIQETVIASLTHNEADESISIAETVTPQDINYDVQFVVGPQVPTGNKRTFILNNSKLG